MRCPLWRTWLLVAALCPVADAGEFRVPGINYPALIRDDFAVLPGGRALRPYGKQVLTGTGSFAIAVSASGRTIVTLNVGISTALGISRPSITVITPAKPGSAWNLTDYAADSRQPHSNAWQGVTNGLAVSGDGSAWIAEGDTGRVVEVSLSTGSRKAAISLSDTEARMKLGTADARPSSGAFSGPLAQEASRNLLIVLDQAGNRAVILDVKRGVMVGSAKTGSLPASLALSADGKRLFVANAGDKSLSIIDIADASAPKAIAQERLQAVPQGITVHEGTVYISLPHEDAIVTVDGKTGKTAGEIPLRIPGLESYRGITPLGMAFDGKAGRLLVAEAGINAVAVIDPESRKVVGQIPTGWFPNSIAVHGGQVYVASARGVGTGPSAPAHRIRMVGGGKAQSFEADTAVLRRGTVSAFSVPDGEELARQTAIVMEANGFAPGKGAVAERAVPEVRNVVLIVKGDRTFDEILGDVERAGDKAVLAEPTFARFGTDGYVDGRKKRFSLKVDVTPNQHEMVARWSFADNFYVDSDYSPEGYRWLTGCRPDLWSETAILYREAGNRAPAGPADDGDLWSHLAKHDIEFRRFPKDFAGTTTDSLMPDQKRADDFIAAVKKDYIEAGKPLPRFMMVSLPNDAGGPMRPEDGYPYGASYVADNDYALGRIVGFLSASPGWKQMAIFVTESGAEGGADHVDSHRTLLLGVGPWFRSNYVSHSNASAPGLLRTIFKLLGVPPLNLYDATAGDLMDMFGAVPDFTPYEAKPEDSRLFDPARVK